jgi:serine phosphatase RsbU (regulator of sigma subunit)
MSTTTRNSILLKACCCLIWFNSSFVFSQQRVDSLKLFVQTAKEDTVKINALNALVRAMHTNSSSYNYILEQLSLSEKLRYKAGAASGLLNQSTYFYWKGEFKPSLDIGTKALSLMKEIGNKKGEAGCYIIIGLDYIDLGDYQKAVIATRKAIQLYEEINDLTGAGTGYNSLANIFFYQNKYKEALSYQFHALKLREQTTDRFGIGMSYNNIGLIYLKQHNYDSALHYFRLAVSIKERFSKKGSIGTTYTNIGNTYFELHRYNDALAYQLKALEDLKVKQDKGDILSAYGSIGKIYEAKLSFSEAMRYYKLSLDMAKQISMKQGMAEAYQNLSSVYKSIGNLDSALHYMSLYHNEKDSLLNKETFKQLTELNTRYETEKKEKEILLLTKDQQLTAKIMKQQELVRWGLIGGLALLSVSVYSIYRRYHFKQKANILLEKQKEEIQQKNTIITDSIDYAKTIQESVLPTAEKIKTHLLDFFILNKPKAIVSGDFYWIEKINDRIICAVADCTGHGVPGAFMSLLGYNMLENIVRNQQEIRPEIILEKLNEEVKQKLAGNFGETKHGMDISIISLDINKGSLEFAGAHNSVYIVRNQELIELKADRAGIGSSGSKQHFTKYTFKLKEKDMIYLFSDGFPDQIGGPNRKKFYYPPFKELLLQISSMDVETQKMKLNDMHLRWMGGNMDQTDDILILGIRI